MEKLLLFPSAWLDNVMEPRLCQKTQRVLVVLPGGAPALFACNKHNVMQNLMPFSRGQMMYSNRFPRLLLEFEFRCSSFCPACLSWLANVSFAASKEGLRRVVAHRTVASSVRI